MSNRTLPFSGDRPASVRVSPGGTEHRRCGHRETHQGYVVRERTQTFPVFSRQSRRAERTAVLDSAIEGDTDHQIEPSSYGRVTTKLVSWDVPRGGGSSGAGDVGWPGMMHLPLALSSVAVPPSTFVMAPLCGQPMPATTPKRK
jgi:hypothetical protein